MAKINPIILTSGHPVHGIDITQTISLAHNHTLYTLYFPYSLPPYTQSVFSLSLSLSRTHTPKQTVHRDIVMCSLKWHLSLSPSFMSKRGQFYFADSKELFPLKKFFMIFSVGVHLRGLLLDHVEVPCFCWIG